MQSVFCVSSSHLSVNIVVLYQFTVTCIENFPSKVEAWGLSDGEKGSRLRLCFRVVDDVPGKKGMDLWKQMSSSKCSFTCICGIFSPLNPSTTTVYARSAFYPSLRFTLSLQSTFYTQSAFYPWSAVCSPQSAVRSLRLDWPLKQFMCKNNNNNNNNNKKGQKKHGISAAVCCWLTRAQYVMNRMTYLW